MIGEKTVKEICMTICDNGGAEKKTVDKVEKMWCDVSQFENIWNAMHLAIPLEYELDRELKGKVVDEDDFVRTEIYNVSVARKDELIWSRIFNVEVS